jgi:probable rRNA maturation factor
MISVQISDSFTGPDPLESHPESLFQNAGEAALQEAGASLNSDLTILLTEDEHMRRLNGEFLGIDEPTDVLAFPADYNDPDTGNPYLGDVMISYPRAQEQAAAGGHTAAQELELLVVHGILHLLGYDHVEPDDKDAMWALQQRSLARLDNPLSPP